MFVNDHITLFNIQITTSLSQTESQNFIYNFILYYFYLSCFINLIIYNYAPGDIK